MRVQPRTVSGGGGIGLSVREWGDPKGRAVLFIHGWSQSHQCWMAQFGSESLARLRLVALDLRGHGDSEAPQDAAAYASGEAWADDIAAIIRELHLERPILVGWSYGGFVIGDYLRKYGQSGVSGIVLVAAAVVLGVRAFGTLIGPGFLDNAPAACSPDPAVSEAAMRRFLQASIVRALAPQTLEAVWQFNLRVSPQVRGLLIERELDFTDVLEQLKVPVLAVQGRADTVILPAMTDHIVSHTKSARASWYDGVGHAPFLEAPERFNRELLSFAGY